MFSVLSALSPTRPAARGDDLDRVLRALEGVDLGVPWSPHPHAVELALLDAVFTIRTTYGSPTTGVRGWVSACAAHAGRPCDDLARLATSGAAMRSLAENGTVTRQRLMGGALKVDAATTAARALHDLSGSPRSADDVRGLLPGRYVEARDAFASVEGLGVETFEYFLLLLGSPGRRAEAAWTRVVSAACEDDVSPEHGQSLLGAAAAALAVEPAQLAHAVWRHGKRG
ncbi:hypothetical protein KLP28_13780 [Nocardioidaceae bacterium]|nr:hypothetical protein KLP28_13780 [Nocardioidaceae bacterium]